MKKFSAYIFTFLVAANIIFNESAFAQIKADKLFSEYAYTKAIVKYEKYLKHHSTNIKAWSNLGDCYRLTNNMQGAEKAYSKVAYSPLANPEVTFYYAQALLSNGNYDEAKKSISLYKQTHTDDARADEILKAINDINKFYKDSTAWYVEKLNINSPDGDFCPAIYKDGIVFTSNRERLEVIGRKHSWTGKQFNALYFSKGSVQNFQPPQPFAEVVETKYNNGPVSFKANGNEMYFTRNNIENGKVLKSSNHVVKLKIFSSKLSNNEWQTEIPFDYNNNQYSVAHPSLSADGNELYFVSDVQGGYGGMDIYRCKRVGAKWSRAENLGPEINTKGNEVFPFIGIDNTLYFSSDGHSGLGGLDIYYCNMRDGKFSAPENPGYPINSNNDDFGITLYASGKAGYLSSNRNNQGENDDIFYFKKQCVVINGLVFDEKTLKGLPASSVKIKETGTDKEIKITDHDGIFTICLQPGKEYEFIADKETYISGKRTISPKDFTGNNDLELKIPMKKIPPVVFDARGYIFSESGIKKPMEGAMVRLLNLTTNKADTVTIQKDGNYYFGKLDAESNYELTVLKKRCAPGSVKFSTAGLKESFTFINDFGIYCIGDIVQVENIYYDLNKFNIRPDAALELNKLVDVFNKYPTMKIELRSHTDSRASDAYNLSLSVNRAKAAVDYIVSQGINKNRLTGKGFGETKLLNKCKNGVKCTEEEHQLNRRTEFKILAL